MQYSAKTHVRWSWTFVQKYQRALGLYLLMELLSLFSGLLFIWMSKRAIDSAVKGDTAEVVVVLVWVGACLLISFSATLIGNRVNERTRAQMLIDLQNQMTATQMNASWRQTGDWHTGELMLRANVDSQETIQVLGNTWISTLVTLIRIIAATALLYWLDPLLALILLAILPLILLSKSFFRRLRNLNNDLKEREGELGKVLQDNFRHRLFIRAVNWQDQRWEKVQNIQQDIYMKKLAMLDFSTLSRASLGLVIQGAYLTTFIWSVWKLQSATITFGTMSAFMQLVGRIQGPMVTMLSHIPVLVRFRSSLDRVIDVLQVPVEPTLYPQALDSIDMISLHQLSFRYGDNEFLQNICMKFKKGQPTAILAPSGKGKTTLLRIIMGLFPADSGKVLLLSKGQSVVMSGAFRCNFSYVPQGDKLLSGTIRYNLGIQGDDFHDKIKNALIVACADFIYSLPDGLDTVVGEGGFGLSEGQAQRIGVARAILQDTQVWLFDEVTSSLDDATAIRLVNNLIEAGKQKTIIFVTHDCDLSQKFSSIYYID